VSEAILDRPIFEVTPSDSPFFTFFCQFLSVNKPPYVGVSADLVYRLFLPILSFHIGVHVPLKTRILAMNPAKWLQTATSANKLNKHYST